MLRAAQTCLPRHAAGLVALGSPVGTREFVAAKLEEASVKHEALFARLPDVQDLQCAWLLLLLCAVPRWTYLLRIVPPADTVSFAEARDAAVIQCLGRLSGADDALVFTPTGMQRAHFPLRMGGMGCRRPRRIGTQHIGPFGRTPSGRSP